MITFNKIAYKQSTMFVLFITWLEIQLTNYIFLLSNNIRILYIQKWTSLLLNTWYH